MPAPNEVHVDAALTNLSVAYANPAFIADRLAPVVPVRKQSDKYFIYDAERELFRASNDRRAPGAEANEVNFTLSTDHYFAEDHALSSPVPDEERENADPVIQPMIDRTEFLRSKIDLNKEIELAARLTDPAVITQNETLAGADQWSDPTSDPIAAVEAVKATIMASVQVLPNTLVLPYEVYTRVRLHPKITERLTCGHIGAVNETMLAQIFDVERVLVPRAFRNAASPGQAPAMQYIWGRDALLCYVPPRPALKQVAVAYTFAWTGAPGSVAGHRVDLWREEPRKAHLVRVQRYYDQKTIAPGAAYLWKDAVA